MATLTLAALVRSCYNGCVHKTQLRSVGRACAVANQISRERTAMAEVHSNTTTEYFKTCTKCGKTLPATREYFCAQKRGKYGLQARCRECHYESVRKYYAENPEKMRERDRKYRAANTDKVREYNRKYRAENLEAAHERDRKRYAANPERSHESYRKWRTGNLEAARKSARERARKWGIENPEKKRANLRNRRARKLAAPGSHTAADLREQLKRQKSCCYYCGCSIEERANRHVEHVVPLSRGGSNDISNIVLACATCNLRKNDKLPHEWVDGGRLL